mgnify:CR=1 FL=1
MEAGLCLLTGVFEMGDLFVLSCASACAACAGPAPCAEIAESGTPPCSGRVPGLLSLG